MITPLPRPEPDLRPGFEVELRGSIPQGSTRVYIYKDVLHEVLRHVQPHTHSGGLLEGWYCLGDAGTYVEVTGFGAAGPLKSNTELAARVRSKEIPPPGPAVPGRVGWFHCRAAPGPGPTPQDLLIHQSYFPLSWQLMLLVEVGSKSLTLFQSLPGGPLNTGIHLIQIIQKTSDWHGGLEG